jgi:hypothetical protein
VSALLHQSCDRARAESIVGREIANSEVHALSLESAILSVPCSALRRVSSAPQALRVLCWARPPPKPLARHRRHHPIGRARDGGNHAHVWSTRARCRARRTVQAVRHVAVHLHDLTIKLLAIVPALNWVCGARRYARSVAGTPSRDLPDHPLDTSGVTRDTEPVRLIGTRSSSARGAAP